METYTTETPLFPPAPEGATYGEGVTDPQTMFDAAAKGNVNYVHYCLEANGEMIAATHGVERSALLHVAGNNGSIELTKVGVQFGDALSAYANGTYRFFSS